MTRNSSDACWSSDDSSFGWVDMEDTEPAAAKKVTDGEERIADTEDESGEDSDSTQFDAESDTKLVREGAIRSKGNNPVTVKGAPLKAPGTINASPHKTSENGTSAESANESSEGSDRKNLKRFTRSLLVKKERHSHALSDDSDIDSPPLKRSLRIKTEAGTTQQKTNEDKRATLIEGVLLDTVQPLPFDIGANEDVWVVQCPYEMSESTLKGKTLNFNGISYAEQFEGRVLLTSNPKPVNLLLPKSPVKLKSLTPTGHIIFKEKEISPHIYHPVCNEDNMTSLPTGLKERHPLFGADLSLVQRLCSQLQKRKKKKKKKKKRDVSDLGITFLQDESEITEAENSAKFSNSLDASSVHNKKKKKKDKHLDEQIVAFSQDSGIKNHNLQLPTFHSVSSPKMPSEKNRNGFFVSDCIQSELQQKKHKKIKHEPVEAVSPEITNVHSELAYATPSKKRKHKHLEYSFQSDRQVSVGTSDEAENILSQKRKKRKCENESNNSYNVYSTSERTVESSFAESSGPISPKKKKHHKHERDFLSKNIESVNNKSCSEAMTLDPVSDELLHTVKKKKKKIKENDTECVVTSNIKTNVDINCISTKKKKKVKMENSDEYVGQMRFDARHTKNDVSNVTGADLDFFDVNRKNIYKEERRKFEETGHSAEFSKHTFSNSLLKQESSYLDHSPITDEHQKKKKKKRKS